MNIMIVPRKDFTLKLSIFVGAQPIIQNNKTLSVVFQNCVAYICETEIMFDRIPKKWTKTRILRYNKKRSKIKK